ncbi:MAG: hypothetical protein L6Q99_03175 [Planctomycetes bacterium]|nr:hypothetical protein [Planctomycetota bacterium]
MDRDSGFPVFLGALVTAARQRAAWCIATLGVALLALAAALPWYGGVDALVGHRYEPGALIANLDETFRAEHRDALDALGASSRAALAGVALLAMLFGAFTAGGWLTLFHDRRRGDVARRFLGGGARFFGRFARVWFLTLLLLVFCGWLVYGDPWITLVKEGLVGVRDAEEFVSERSAVTLVWVQDALYALLFALVLCWADYTRTRLALHDGRSAFWAGLESLALIVARPVRTLAPLAALLLVEAGGLWLFARSQGALEATLGEETGLGTIVALGVLGLAALAWRACVRGARYAATTRTSRELVPPLPIPDPWGAAPDADPGKNFVLR